jgi:hypothetical protein
MEYVFTQKKNHSVICNLMTFFELISIGRFISLIHLVPRLTTDPLPLPKPALHKVRYCPSPFNFQYSLFSLRSSSSFLRLLPRLPVTSIFHSIFYSIMCFIRQLRRKISPIQIVFIRFIVGRMFLSSLTISFIHSICPIDLVLPYPAPHFRTFQIFLTYFPKCQRYGII